MSAVHVVVVHPRDIAQPTTGGIQTFLRDFIAHSPDDFDIVVAGVTNDEQERPVGRWQTVDIAQRTARFMPLSPSGSLVRRPASLVRAARAVSGLRRELIRHQPILQLHRPYRTQLFSGHRGPRVRFIHVDLEHLPSGSGWRRLTWLYRGFSDDLAQFDRVFIANERGALALRAAQPALAERIEFLSGWYDERVFTSVDETGRPRLRAEVASELALPAQALDDRWVLFVGRLEDVKNPVLAVESFAELVASGRADVRLLVCGDGELRDAVSQRSAALGIAARVHLLGDRRRDVVARLMAGSDVLLVTSEAEGGGPRVVLEALGCGLPVVSTLVGEVRRSVVTGRSGWLADEATPASLAAGLRWALDQPRGAVAATAVEAARPFVAARVLARVYDAYRELAEMRRTG